MNAELRDAPSRHFVIQAFIDSVFAIPHSALRILPAHSALRIPHSEFE